MKSGKTRNCWWPGFSLLSTMFFLTWSKYKLHELSQLWNVVYKNMAGLLRVFPQLSVERVTMTPFIWISPFPHNDTFWHPWETRVLKTLWVKEKLLVTSNFSFNHSVFYLLENFLLFPSNLKLSSADCFNLGQSKILSSGNGLKKVE